MTLHSTDVANAPLLSASAMRLRTELDAFARGRLPDAMVPARFVVLPQLPKLPNGKVDRSKLPLKAFADATASSFVAPRTPDEIRIAQIWCQVLGLAQVGVTDSFFDLGGDSLAAAQMAARVKEAFGVALNLRRLFDHPSIAELAKMLTGKGAAKLEREGNPRSLSHSDLFAEATLPADVTPDERALPAISTDWSHIFLTGATGYTGAYLLRELLDRSKAKIYVLVRARDAEDASQRVQRNLQQYGLLREDDVERLIGLVGDLGQPYFGLRRSCYEGLAQHAELIVHNGALSSYAVPYKRLKAVNVLGTLEVLRLAGRRRIKPVHFISSLAVYPGHDGIQDFSEVPLVEADGVVGGYRQSKWVADKLVSLAAARGLPVCVYRPGLITGAQDTGACSTDTFLNAAIKGCIQLGMALDFNVCLEMVPVDFCAKAVAYVALNGTSSQASSGTYFNLPAANTVRWSELVDMLEYCGYPVQRVPYSKWYQSLASALERGEDNALAEFFPLFGSDTPSADLGYPASTPHFRRSNLQTALTGSGIVCRPIDTDFLKLYLDYFIGTGYLPAPTLTGGAA